MNSANGRVAIHKYLTKHYYYSFRPSIGLLRLGTRPTARPLYLRRGESMALSVKLPFFLSIFWDESRAKIN